MLAREDRSIASERLDDLALTITCPACGKVFRTTGKRVSHAIHDGSSQERAWVLAINGTETHRCPIP